jgi:hypothetical protein
MGDWRASGVDYRNGMLLGAMNARAFLGGECRVPLSLSMLRSTLESKADGRAAFPDSDPFAATVWFTMSEYFGCELPGDTDKAARRPAREGT